MSIKKDYINWAQNALSIIDSTKKQYVSSLENLSRIVGYNIFESDNIDKISKLYDDLIKDQKNKSSICIFSQH